MKLLARARNMIVSPGKEWEVVSAESTGTGALFTGYVVPLAAIGPICMAIGMSAVGVAQPIPGTMRLPVGTAVNAAIASYLLTLISVFIVALIIDGLAPVFSGQRNSMQAMKLSVYANTPGWLAGILFLVPSLSIVVLLAALYDLYLLYLGIPVLMKAPRAKSIGYTAVVVLSWVAIFFVINLVSSLFVGTPTA